jgi:hypothetical protein
LAEGADLAEVVAARLLRDLRTIFDAELAKQQKKEPGLQSAKQEIASQYLVERLLTLQESPWAHLENGRPLTQDKLAGLLRGFGIRPGNIGPETQRKRGYRRLQFMETWEAYLEAEIQVSPLAPPNQGAQVAQNGRKPPVSSQFQGAQEGPAVHPAKASKPAEIRQTVQPVHPADGGLGENIEKPPSEPPSAVPPLNHGGKDFSLQNATEVTRDPAASTSGKGNGERPHKPRNIVADLIREIAASHPHWSEERLSKQSGQPLAVVKRALANPPRPNSGGTAGAS